MVSNSKGWEVCLAEPGKMALVKLIVAFALLSPMRMARMMADEVVGLPSGVLDTQDARDVPDTPQDSLAQITVPDGFRVTLFAGEPHVSQPIAFDFDDRGRLWVVECYSHPNWQPEGSDRVLIFEDTDHDGQFDRRTVFWDRGNYLSGIAVGHGGIFLGNTPHLIFLADADRDDRPDGPPEVVLDGWSRDSPHNVLNNLCFAPDGWLYGCIGQNRDSGVGPPGSPAEDRIAISRGIWRFHPVRRTFEVVALGAVNPWGLDFNSVGDGFFSNCVLPHLWHLLPGAYYERRPGEKDNPYAYERIPPICDHRHWGEGAWTESRGGRGLHGRAGGGHAHTGAMIYLGDNFPSRYRDTFFTGNLHGNRINHDRLERVGAAYIGSHEDDFLYGNNPWFRCLSQKYGPDGSVFISDWHDVGECHDQDGSHRSSGRIYRVAFGVPALPIPGDLRDFSLPQLIELHAHPNDWYARRARRVLQERAARGDDLRPAIESLQAWFESDRDVSIRLRAMWSLFAMEATNVDWLLRALDDDNEYVRAWGVRLLVDRGPPGRTVGQQLSDLATHESSAYVRLVLATSMRRLDRQSCWEMARALALHEEDDDDPALPLMIWYGIEPHVVPDVDRSIRLIESSRIAKLQQFLARRLAETP